MSSPRRAAVAESVMAQPARPALAIDRDRILQLVFMAAIALYLVLTLAWPLYTMLSKSMTTYRFNLASFEMQVDAGQGWQPPRHSSASRHWIWNASRSTSARWWAWTIANRLYGQSGRARGRR